MATEYAFHSPRFWCNDGEVDNHDLRQRVVSGGHVSAHACQYCNEFTICNPELARQQAPFAPPTVSIAFPNSEDLLFQMALKTEEIRQRVTAGCKLWSMVLDEVNYHTLNHTSETDGVSGGPGIGNEDSGALERLQYKRQCDAGDQCVTVGLFRENLHRLYLSIIASENGTRQSWQSDMSFTVLNLPTQAYERRALPVNVDPQSADSFRLMRTWLSNCDLQHGCGLKDHKPTSMPSMLLSVREEEATGSIKLVKVDPGAKHHYLALSYCWGPDGQRKVLSTDTAEELMLGVKLQDFDATIQDAVRVTRELGYAYLWIDALCIPQDDAGAEAKAREISRMGQIYESAHLTIVAARASSVGEGFLFPRQPAGSDTPESVFQLACKWGEDDTKSVILLPTSRKDEFLEEPWESRGWTLQEAVFSGRQLRFGSKQTSWMCLCSPTIYEDFDGWIDSPLQYLGSIQSVNKLVARLGQMMRTSGSWATSRARGFMSHRLWKAWYELIEAYSRRSFTYTEDRLPAISGIARRLAFDYGDEYWCGLWKSRGPSELLWTSADRSGPTSKPTWSWSSHEGGVNISRHKAGFDRFTVDPRFEIVNCTPQFATGSDEYGAVTACRLKVRGLMRPAPFELHECHYQGGRRLKPGDDGAEEQGSKGLRFRYAAIPGSRSPAKLRQAFQAAGAVQLDGDPRDLLESHERPFVKPKMFLLVVGYNKDFESGEGPRGLVLLQEGQDEFSRIGTFHIEHVYDYKERPSKYVVQEEPNEDAYEDEPDSLGLLTPDEYQEVVLGWWAGLENRKEIVLI